MVKDAFFPLMWEDVSSDHCVKEHQLVTFRVYTLRECGISISTYISDTSLNKSRLFIFKL